MDTFMDVSWELSRGVYMGKTGLIWQFFRALFPSTRRTLSPDAFFTRFWDTRKPQNLPHFRAFPASIQEQCPPKCLIFMANAAKLPNRPGLHSYRGVLQGLKTRKISTITGDLVGSCGCSRGPGVKLHLRELQPPPPPRPATGDFRARSVSGCPRKRGDTLGETPETLRARRARRTLVAGRGGLQFACYVRRTT